MLINMMWMGVGICERKGRKGHSLGLKMGVPTSPAVREGIHPLTILEWMDGYGYILIDD
jgi:hypothetical protein